MNRISLAAIAMLMLTALALPRDGGAERRHARRAHVSRLCAVSLARAQSRDMTGPSLAEIWNRKAGSLASFPRYSPALKSAGIVWTDDTLWCFPE